MSVTNVHQFLQFPIHRDPSSLTLNFNTIQYTFLILGLLHFSFFQFLLARKRVLRFLSTSKSPEIVKTKTIEERPDDQQTLVSETDTEMVLRSLRMVSDDDKELQARLDSSDMFEMFEARNPGLDEVKEAFDVFDDDKDGFISSYDLQTAMQRLGLTEGMELGNCRRMIGLYDENCDGRLDFQEFVNFMENTFN